METLKSLTKPLNGSAGEERSFRSFGSVPYCIGDGSLTKLTVFCCSLYSFSFLFDLCLGLCFIRRIHWLRFKWNLRKSCLNMSTVISNCQIQLYSSSMVASFLTFFRRAWFYIYSAIGIFTLNFGIVASIRLI